MPNYTTSDIRNIALVGHGGAGKTSLVEALLRTMGTIHNTGLIEKKTTVCDFSDEEKERGHSLYNAIVSAEYQQTHLNLIDTPGYPDFLGQTIGSLYGVDMAAVVINAQSGIEVNTRRVFEEAEKAGLGRMVVINKMDAENIDFSALVDGIREMWGTSCVLLNVPVGHGQDFKGVVSTLQVEGDSSGALLDVDEIHNALIESIIEVDEEVMEKYLEGTLPTQEDLSRLIVQAVRAGTLIPIVCCSGKADIGVNELLDAISTCGLSPVDLPRTATKDGDQFQTKPHADGPLVARVFKTRIDPFVQKLSFIRVFSGTLKKDDTVPASSARKGIKTGPLLEVQCKEEWSERKILPSLRNRTRRIQVLGARHHPKHVRATSCHLHNITHSSGLELRRQQLFAAAAHLG